MSKNLLLPNNHASRDNELLSETKIFLLAFKCIENQLVNGIWFSMNLKTRRKILVSDSDSLWPLEAWLLGRSRFFDMYSTQHDMSK
jgi:hypothetical protein